MLQQAGQARARRLAAFRRDIQMQTGTPFSIGRGDDYLGIGSTNGKTWNLNGAPNFTAAVRQPQRGGQLQRHHRLLV
jgi:hypothetical protein